MMAVDGTKSTPRQGQEQLRPMRLGRTRATTGLLILCLLSAYASPSPAAEEPTVSDGGYAWRGLWDRDHSGVAEFRGLAFAQPPVGKLRWRAPQPLAVNIDGSVVTDATRFAPACMQDEGAVDWYIGVAAAFGQPAEVVSRPVAVSEDCLYLNVWTPRVEPGADLPVMVFVHGGGNSGGWSYEPNYHGGALAQRGVVVVTVAYRLGPLGFFAHPALDNGRGQPVANFGLLDLRAAFAWVRGHIRAFGGDPGNISAFGESAGALDLVDLLLADLEEAGARARSFERLVSQSIGGPLLQRQSLQQEQEIGLKMAAAVGLGPDASAAELRAVPAERWVEAVDTLPDDYYPDSVVDGITLKRNPLDALSGLRATGVELILGTNADEWLMYLEPDTSLADLESWIARHPDPEGLRASVADLPDPRRALDRLETFLNMECPSRLLADWANARGGRAWMYRFTRVRAAAGGRALGSYHGAELPYLFASHDAWLATAEADLELGRTMMDYWVGFAGSGNPNGPGRPDWPAFGTTSASVLELGDYVRLLPADWPGLCVALGLAELP